MTVDYAIDEGYTVGVAACSNCGYQWIAMLKPTETIKDLYCPECNLFEIDSFAKMIRCEICRNTWREDDLANRKCPVDGATIP